MTAAFGLKLSNRRQQMAEQIDRDHNDRAAEFDYRRRIVDDIEAILREAEVFRPRSSEPSRDDLSEQSALLRRVAEDLAAYIVR